jgi:hypothetical protein
MKITVTQLYIRCNAQNGNIRACPATVRVIAILVQKKMAQ